MLGCMGGVLYNLDKRFYLINDLFKQERNFGFSKTNGNLTSVLRDAPTYYRRLGNGGRSGKVPYRIKRR